MKLKKLFYLSVFLLVFVLNAFAEDPCKDVNDALLKKHINFEPTILKIIAKDPVFNLCQVTLENIPIKQTLVLYVNPDYVIIQGLMFSGGKEVESKKVLEVERNKLQPRLKELDEIVAMEKKPVKTPISHKLYLITDPFCGHCKRAIHEMLPLVEEYGIDLKIIINPIFPPQSNRKGIEAICKNFKPEEYANEEWAKKEPTQDSQCPKGTEIIEKSRKIFDELSISSVPVFIFSDGSKVMGANIPKVEDMLRKEIKGPVKIK